MTLYGLKTENPSNTAACQKKGISVGSFVEDGFDTRVIACIRQSREQANTRRARQLGLRDWCMWPAKNFKGGNQLDDHPM